MSKQLKNPGKTIFVRNTEQKIPKVIIKTQQLKRETEPSTSKPQSKRSDEKPEKSHVKFDEPQPNSSKHIAEKINTLRKLKPTAVRTQRDGLIEEKITKKMNFPADRAIYRGLMPLGVKTEAARVAMSRDPLPPKDLEPSLSDFCRRETLPEYIFKIEPERIEPKKLGLVPYDGFKITRHMRMWENVENIRN